MEWQSGNAAICYYVKTQNSNNFDCKTDYFKFKIIA